MFRIKHAFLLLTAVLLIPSATPALAISQQEPSVSATATVNCSSYSITLSASLLNPGISYTVPYSITLTPSSGSSINVTDAITATADSSGEINTTATKALGPLSGDFTPTGSLELFESNSSFLLAADSINFTSYSLSCTQPPPAPACSANTTSTSNFNGTNIKDGAYIWFNANFTAKGVPSTGATITFTGSNISFNANQAYNLAVPNGKIVFSPNAMCSSTTFDSVSNTFMTTVPISGSDEILLTGLAFPVPAGFGTAHGNVVWSGTFGTDTSGVTMQLKWGAAVYTTFSTDYNALAVKPTHTNSCSYSNSDHAGTPEGIDSGSGQTFKSFVTGGARGGGGSNWTGSWSGTTSVSPVCN